MVGVDVEACGVRESRWRLSFESVRKEEKKTEKKASQSSNHGQLDLDLIPGPDRKAPSRFCFLASACLVRNPIKRFLYRSNMFGWPLTPFIGGSDCDGLRSRLSPIKAPGQRSTAGLLPGLRAPNGAAVRD